jgi:DNA-binding PadR family transcriptional regulator
LSNGFSARTVYMKHWRGLAKPQVELALDQLAERGWVTELVVQTGTKPRVIYTINPGIHEGLL